MPLGALLIRAAFVLGLAALGGAVVWMRGRAHGEPILRWTYLGMTLCLAAASCILMHAILTHDFRYEYVAAYSCRALEPLYLVASFWGGQEGTFLLWALLAAVLGISLFHGRSWRPAAAITAYLPTVLVLVLFMLIRGGDPFRMSEIAPPDGRSLNPLLRDPWMAIHPPVIFLGYAAMALPAALAWVAAFGRDDKAWAGPALRWAIFGFLTLGAGIIVGGVWAYKVLGWGGYWGWDPVENASLVPWIAGAALMHGLLVQRKTGSLGAANLALAMAGYWLILYATFLTRSGVLAGFSVHSFSGATIHGWLVGALAAAAAVSVLALLVRRFRRPAASGGSHGSLMEAKPASQSAHALPTADATRAGQAIPAADAPQAANPPPAILAWPTILTAAIVILAISGVLVLIGTSWPIFSTWAGSPAVPKAEFYNQVNYPLYVILLALLCVAPFLGWKPQPASRWMPRVALTAILAAVATAAAFVAGGRGIAAMILLFIASAAFFASLIRLIGVARHGWLRTGAHVSHLGFALMFVGIVASGYWDSEEYYSLRLNSPVDAMGYELTYRGYVRGSEPEYEWAVEITDRGGGRHRTHLTMYELPNGNLFRKPGILRRFHADLYIAPVTLEIGEGPGETIELRKNEPMDFYGTGLTFLGFRMDAPDHPESPMRGLMTGMTVEAILEIEVGEIVEMKALPMRVGDRRMQGEPVMSDLLDGSVLTLMGMLVEEGRIRVHIDDGSWTDPEILAVEAAVKPMMGLLWVGTALLGLGPLIAFIRRTREKRSREMIPP